MAPPTAAGQPVRRARLGIRGYLVLYAAGLGSMLLGGSIVHAVAQPDLRLPTVAEQTSASSELDDAPVEAREQERPAP
ncbi:hypothetical protein BU14_0519s0014 [Porphyra umbilicalis]|uniref:Uncharacterized protein n=1 Tax=Porphyra umbilicalis TaxID=2786 RepID=A0A1X6NSN4_PORUM|nr:hypothetical protein BU14_0519s0014 [Porphyra umbilicalis]|eukprot:OSX71598.1 hypothetical protein BU14_0519s0014 [Porphyra umbilicalis]